MNQRKGGDDRDKAFLDRDNNFSGRIPIPDYSKLLGSQDYV